MIRSLPAAFRLLALLLLAACSRHAAPEPAAAPARPANGTMPLTAQQVARLDLAFVAAVTATDVPIAEVPATIAPPPNSRVAVAATVPGVVTRTMVVEGQKVRAGEALATVVSRDVLAFHAAAEQAAARAAVARSSAQRLEQLAREGVIAGARADEAAANRREAEALLRAQRRTLSLVHADGAGGTYTLRAPIAGTVTKAAIETGQPVDGATAPYVIDATDRYELTAQLPERLIRQVRPGMRVALGETIGTVTSVGTVVDQATRSATLRARLPAAPGLVTGGAALVRLLKPGGGTAVAVPSAAVVMIDGKPAVFVRSRDGVTRRAVTSAGEAAGLAVLTAGVAPGEQVATAGTSELKAMAAAR